MVGFASMKDKLQLTMIILFSVNISELETSQTSERNLVKLNRGGVSDDKGQ